ncbi:UDP-N-acetylmuramate dehydrogenase [Mariniblastus fucicola]|uniref:UDP-N-acetylenolpyruvoylglucosamine reductase n=1 Tax=Mariniblastus fucicola TaxID=980251 RepID=A0A5B9P7J1_9BACT|nr:UDP-N-acetylmuramate dehydrogenase [Mariniblastus fucicola]QEG20920.1 UDP-N-acetylenolpyruvoylglucosamine reductase [Mariniblastus fucicola]
MSLISGFEHFVRENEPLSPLTSLRLGGPAEYFAEPTTVEELAAIVKRFSEAGVSVRMIGAGSNVLVPDSGVSGLVIHLSAPAFCQIEIDGNRMRVGGGARLSHLVSNAIREGLNGPQHLVGMPGTIGGALHSNISFPNVDIGTWVRSVDVMKRSGEQLTYSGEDVTFSSRESSLSELVILAVEAEFEKEDPAALTKQLQTLWLVKKAKRPPADFNAAYLFKNPFGESAADLIDSAGMKGTSVGGVSLFDANPNYLVTESGATVADVIKLIETVRKGVHEKLDVQLETAIQIW